MMSLHKWRTLHSMTTQRSNACAAALDGKLFVMGGRDSNYTNLKSCETYQAVPDFYKFLLLSQKLRESAETATFNNKGDDERHIILWKRVPTLPWDIVVHVFRFMERPTSNPWVPIPDMLNQSVLRVLPRLMGR